MKKSILIFAFALTSSLTFAQDATVAEKAEPKFTAAVDVVYPYLWRGVRYYGDDLAIQPYANYSITDKLSFGVWATTNVTSKADSYFEFDWSIAYQISPILSVTLADYYWPATKKNEDWERSSYFDYSDGSAKTLDLSLLFDFSEKGVPIDFTWSTFIGGGDYKGDEDNEAVGSIDSLPKTSADILDNYSKANKKNQFYNERIKVLIIILVFYL